jgi:hypothetical protein
MRIGIFVPCYRAGLMRTKRTVADGNAATDLDAKVRHGFIQET